jgi:hypothetical protein
MTTSQPWLLLFMARQGWNSQRRTAKTPIRRTTLQDEPCWLAASGGKGVQLCTTHWTWPSILVRVASCRPLLSPQSSSARAHIKSNSIPCTDSPSPAHFASTTFFGLQSAHWLEPPHEEKPLKNHVLFSFDMTFFWRLTWRRPCHRSCRSCFLAICRQVVMLTEPIIGKATAQRHLNLSGSVSGSFYFFKKLLVHCGVL